MNSRNMSFIEKENNQIENSKKILKGNKFFEPIEQYTKSNKSYIEKKSKRLFSKRKRFNINKTQNQKLIKNKVKDKDK